MNKSSEYQELAEEIYQIKYGLSNYKREENIKSIKAQFYKIEKDLKDYLQININGYDIQQKVNLIKLVYEFNHFYYSREKIIKFFSINFEKLKSNNVDSVLSMFSKFNKGKSINKKYLNDLERCVPIIVNTKESRENTIKLIEKQISNEERNVVKVLGENTISTELLSDLKKYYFRVNTSKQYWEYIAYISDMNMGMAECYCDFLGKLRYKLIECNLIENEKKEIYNDLLMFLKAIKEQTVETRKKSLYERDLLALFYIKINKADIAKTLKYVEKLHNFIEKQIRNFNLYGYNERPNLNNRKITNICSDVLVGKNKITKSDIRILQMDNKEKVPVLLNRYEKKLAMVNNKVKFKKMALREIYIDKESKKMKDLKDFKNKYKLKNISINSIIKKIMNDNKISYREEIYINTLMNRGIALEIGVIDDLMNINRIDIIITDVILEIYSMNNILEIQKSIKILFLKLNNILIDR
ncbi:hypothetical protein [Clostridium guangxiense]|uniref:hypothetical protein n=1 Tax=Clostridium guangxiense TaxID=1662055 RepID=UPI001E3F5940|nr:hypothetical protein [Clostridium guangxiense]MCD2347398.1 hypothetical protein [Clostridium guangxiense]